MYIIKITNKVQSIIEFGKKEEREKMVEAIKNCINNPDEYPNILYSDQKAILYFLLNI